MNGTLTCGKIKIVNHCELTVTFLSHTFHFCCSWNESLHSKVLNSLIEGKEMVLTRLKAFADVENHKRASIEDNHQKSFWYYAKKSDVNACHKRVIVSAEMGLFCKCVLRNVSNSSQITIDRQS
jgi:hypothetical protein